MTVEDLIERLRTFPPQLPVRLKTYGCGHDSWEDLTEQMVRDMIDESTGDRICEIQADFN